MTNHDHKECEHENLKYCKKCDLVECQDCKGEFTRKLTYTFKSNSTQDTTWSTCPLCGTRYMGSHVCWKVNANKYMLTTGTASHDGCVTC